MFDNSNHSKFDKFPFFKSEMNAFIAISFRIKAFTTQTNNPLLTNRGWITKKVF